MLAVELIYEWLDLIMGEESYYLLTNGEQLNVIGGNYFEGLFGGGVAVVDMVSQYFGAVELGGHVMPDKAAEQFRDFIRFDGRMRKNQQRRVPPEKT